MKPIIVVDAVNLEYRVATLLDNYGIRLVDFEVIQDAFGDTIFKINPHLMDLYTADSANIDELLIRLENDLFRVVYNAKANEILLKAR